MGAEFVFLDFENKQVDGAETGGYASPSSPEFREKQLEKFQELAPEIDIVITTAVVITISISGANSWNFSNCFSLNSGDEGDA